MRAKLPEYGCDGPGKPVFKLRKKESRKEDISEPGTSGGTAAAAQALLSSCLNNGGP